MEAELSAYAVRQRRVSCLRDHALRDHHMVVEHRLVRDRIVQWDLGVCSCLVWLEHRLLAAEGEEVGRRRHREADCDSDSQRELVQRLVLVTILV